MTNSPLWRGVYSYHSITWL